MPEIDIAVPTYNCAAWIDDFLTSILKQDFDSWRIIARDDASNDNTAALLTQWKNRLGDRLTVLPNSGSSNLGPVGNYNAILSTTTASWVMLGDPDDVWLPGKLALTLLAMQTAETTYGASTPVLVFADASVVDEQLQPVADSYWQWSRANLGVARIFHRVVMDSPAISSTMMVNRALLELALPMPDTIWSQDWWLTMVAAAFGQVIRLDQRTVLYRRHSANDSLEPYATSAAGALRRLLAQPSSARKKLNYLLERTSRQCAAFSERFHGKLAPPDLAAVKAASRLSHAGGIESRFSVVRHGLWYGSLPKNIGLMLLL